MPAILLLLAGLGLSGMGGYLVWQVLGGAQFTGNIGRTMSFAQRLGLSATILAAGLALLALARFTARRLRRQG